MTILTNLTRSDAHRIMDLGKQLHEESKFHTQSFNVEKCWAILEATVLNPSQYFIAYDEEFKGFIIMKMTEHYFSGNKWSADLALYVKPEYRGSHLSSELIKAAREWSKANGAEEMTIYHNTGIKTEKAERFFNQQGLKTAGYIFTEEL
jgi:GNAT superfamily N-acetyltransferase